MLWWSVEGRRAQHEQWPQELWLGVRGGGVWLSISGVVLPKGAPLMLGEEVTWPNLYYSFK